VAILAVLLVLLAAKLWRAVRRGKLHLHRLHAMLQQAWQFAQALAVPSAVIAAGGVLMVLVLWQQQAAFRAYTCGRQSQERLTPGSAAASSSKKCAEESGLGADAHVSK
jgi:hypothetical protein